MFLKRFGTIWRQVVLSKASEQISVHLDSGIDVNIAKCYHYGYGTERNLETARFFINIAYEECRYWKALGNAYSSGEMKT